MKQFESQMQSVKDHVQQYQDGLITGHEAFQAIQSILSGVDSQAVLADHDRQLADEE
jgi:hypothetical protein